MWDLTKKIFHFISNVIWYSLIVILIIIGIMVALYFVDQQKARSSGVQRAPLFGAYIIISQSMEPTIHVGDAVITMRVDADKLKKDDVITFYSDQYNVVVTHRIVGIFPTKDGKVAYRTKGDNNNTEDESLIAYDRIYGRVLLKLPYIGYIQQFLTQGFGWIIFIVLPCLWIIISDIIKIIRGDGGNNKGGKTETKQSYNVHKNIVDIDKQILEEKNDSEEII